MNETAIFPQQIYELVIIVGRKFIQRASWPNSVTYMVALRCIIRASGGYQSLDARSALLGT